MSRNVRFCEYCHSNPQPFGGLGGMGYSTYLDENEYECQNCGNKVKDLPLLVDEYNILIEISTDKSFIEAMIDLKEKDIIEYNLKMSQFKAQLSQTQVREESGKVYCPKCNSTSITTGARGVNWTFGLIGASKTVNRCANCGHTWKP